MAIDPSIAETIRRKKAEYCRLADTNQWHLFDRIMVPEITPSFCGPDGTVVTEGGVTYSFASREAWADFFRQAFESQQTIHIVGPGELEQTGPDEVKAVFGVIYHAASKEVTGGWQGTGGGHYHETWVRKGEDWFMAEMKLMRIYWKVLGP